MSEQRTFASVAWQPKGKVTQRVRFLAEMDQVIPWRCLLAVISPHYPTAGRGRQPLGLAKMLRIYFVQQWFNLSDPAAEDPLYDSELILRFRHLLIEKRLLLKTGTIVEATIIAAPSSTKHAARQRDPEMPQTRKGKAWHFGMKVQVGTDPHGLVHRLTGIDAATADITQLPALLHGAERDLYGDQAYWHADHRVSWEATGGRYRVIRRGTTQRPLAPHQKRTARRADTPARNPARARFAELSITKQAFNHSCSERS